MTLKNLFNKSGDQLAKEAISDYQKSKDEFAVIKKLQKALSLGIENYPLDQVYLYIGSSYFDLSIYDKANEAYKKGLEYNPKNHSLLSNLGLSYSLMGDPERSIEYYRASLDIKPDNSYAHNNVGLYNYEKGNHFEALESLEKAIKINPKLLVAYSLKAKCLASIGLYKEAEIVFKEAVRMGFDNGAVLKVELENIRNLNPRLFWNAQKFLELIQTFGLDQNAIDNLVKAQRNPKEFYAANSNLLENKVLTAFEIKNALSWYLLIEELSRGQRILTIDFYSSDPSEILGKIKKLLDVNKLPINDTLDEFENQFMFSDSEEILISIASKLKISNSIELVNIWTSDHVLNIHPIKETEWESLNYPFVSTDNGFGKVHPLATSGTIEEFLTRE